MQSDPSKNLELIQRWIEAHNRDDIEAELDCWDDDAEMTIVPTGMTYKGKAALREAAKMAVKSKGRKVITHIFASGDWVCAEYTAYATIHGPMNAHGIVIPAGISKNTQLKVCFLANIREGKIVLSREYWDTGSMTKQLQG